MSSLDSSRLLVVVKEYLVRGVHGYFIDLRSIREMQVPGAPPAGEAPLLLHTALHAQDSDTIRP